MLGQSEMGHNSNPNNVLVSDEMLLGVHQLLKKKKKKVTALSGNTDIVVKLFTVY